MSHESTRPSLLSRLRDPRDHGAWREFDDQYRDLIRRYCARFGLQWADTEDICQVVMLAMMRALPGFNFDPAQGRFRGYLGRTVTNAISLRLARADSAPPSLEGGVLELLAARQDEPLDSAWEEEWSRHHLRRALGALRRRAQPGSLEAFERLLKGERPAAVAQAMGMSEEALHKVKQRIGELLRAEVERQIREEDEPRQG